MAHYKSIHQELYTMDPVRCFVPSFLKAIADNSEESFRSIMSQPAPGIFTFDMLVSSWVENFRQWINEHNIKIALPTTTSHHGIILDDIGFCNILERLMDDYIQPLSQVFFPDVGGSTLDSCYGFLLEFGTNRETGHIGRSSCG
ncbi:hypothetical protein Droror1_Dr00022717 [Drosera rotundifolia]